MVDRLKQIDTFGTFLEKLQESKEKSESEVVTNNVIKVLLLHQQACTLPELIQEANLNFKDLEKLDERIELWKKSGLVEVGEENHVQNIKLTQFGLNFAQKNLGELVEKEHGAKRRHVLMSR